MWAQSTGAVPAADDAAATQRIMTVIRPLRHLDTRDFQFKTAVERKLMRTRFALAAAVIFLIVAISPWQWFSGDSSAPLSPLSFSLDTAELDEIRMAVNEMKRIFPEGIQWIHKTGDKIDIRAGNPNSLSNPGTPNKILVTFHVIARKNGKTISVKRSDFVIWGDEPVETGGKNKEVIWTQPLDEKHVCVALDMPFQHKDFKVHIRDRFLLTYGKQFKIATTRFQETDYEIHQTAYLL